MTLVEFINKNHPSVGIAKLVFNYLGEKYPKVPLSKVTDSSSGGTPNRGISNYYGGNIPWLKSGEVTDGLITEYSETITAEGMKNSSAKMFPKGTLLVAMYGATAGKIGILDFDSTTNQALCAIFPQKDVLRDYLFWYFRQARVDFIEISKGGAQPNISQTVIGRALIPLPDEKIQKSVIDFLSEIEKNDNVKPDFIFPEIYPQINQLFSHRQSYSGFQTELKTQSNLLSKLRQAYLQEAVMGKLSEPRLSGLKDDKILDEKTTDKKILKSLNHKNHSPDKNTQQTPPLGAGGLLLAQIKTQKAELIKQGKLRKEKPLPPIEPEEIPFKIPDNWVWCRLGDCSINRDGERIPISQSEREKKEKIYDYYGASGVIDKIDGFTHNGDFLLIGEDGANLVTRSTPIAFIARGKFWVNNHAHIMEFTNETILRYLEIYMNAIDLKPYITGGFQPKLSQGNLNLIPTPLPPLSEQKAIVEKVEGLLATVSLLEEENKIQQKEVQRLMGAVLQEAFGGSI